MNLNNILITFFNSFGINDKLSIIIIKSVYILLAVLITYLFYKISKKIILKVIKKIIMKTATRWDNIINENKLFERLSFFIPAILLYFFNSIIFESQSKISIVIYRIISAYMILITIFVIDAFLTSVNKIYINYKVSKIRPIKGYIQVVKIILYLIGLILIITTVINKSAVGLLSGIGALSAVIILVFKDSILGLVASIQLTGNNMVQIGDWIEIPQYGADGDIIDITLQSVKVQNFDKTLVTVPIYSLISSSFKNWRGMKESGGRRIKRSLNIDLKSIKFCTTEMIEKFKRIELLKDYIESKSNEIEEYNKIHNVNTSEVINGRNITNIGTFRAYAIAYLKAHPKIFNDMTFLVRQLTPGPNGLPIEIYVFTNDIVWANYESIQADIFDHLLAIIPQFELSIYQNPGSYDITLLTEKLNLKEK